LPAYKGLLLLVLLLAIIVIAVNMISGPTTTISTPSSTSSHSQSVEITYSLKAHLWFVAIHPFRDGNGRVVRLPAGLSSSGTVSSPDGEEGAQEEGTSPP